MKLTTSVAIPWKYFHKTKSGNSIITFQSKHTRAINLGYIRKSSNESLFIPGRLNFGATRMLDTYQATIESLSLPPIRQLLRQYQPEQISTVTVLRETLACQLGVALSQTGVGLHFGDAFIGATHVKGDGPIHTAYLYENIEGLCPDGLWIIGESFCTGRNLTATMNSLLSKFHPSEILFIAPLASRLGINNVDAIIAKHNIPTTYLVWGALFGVDEKTLYDMPWGHTDTEPFDKRDQQLFIRMYGNELCVGGDFGNAYYCPPLAKALYQTQLEEHRVQLNIPSAKEMLATYTTDEILVR